MKSLDKDKALVIFSGGQDSTVTLFWALEQYKEVSAISFDYGQKHSIEIKCARKVIEITKPWIEHFEVLQVPHILHGSSPLIDSSESLEQYENFASMDKIIGGRIELTFVPMRNALFLTLAANRAACEGIGNLVTGVCQADNANYPDCRRSFIISQESTIRQALGDNNFFIETPLMNLSKKKSIMLARSFEGCYEALAWTHSAYDGQYPPIGQDHATVLRAHGFLEAELPDPLIIRAYHEGKMDLPGSQNYRSDAAQLTIKHLIKYLEKTS